MAGHYLVTGGCGFIGSHLVESLLGAGHRVTVLDDLSSGRRENLSAAAHLIEGDVCDPQTVARAMAGVDGCFHLASVASVALCAQQWERSHQINQGGSVNVLAAARSQGGGRPVPVVLASSAAVYGECAAIPLSEILSVQPISSYGADKLGTEMQARVSAAMFAGRVIALRIFNVFGPRQMAGSPYSGVVTNFIDLAVAGREVVIFGDGQQVRDFIYISDVVMCLTRAMARLARLDQAFFGVYNVCTGQSTSIGDLAQVIVERCRSGSAVVHVPGRIGDIRVSLGDPQSCRQQLGFSASVALAEGVSRTVDWILSGGGGAA